MLTMFWRVTAVTSADSSHREGTHDGAHQGRAVGIWLGDGDVTVAACLGLPPHIMGAAVIFVIGTLGGVMLVSVRRI